MQDTISIHSNLATPKRNITGIINAYSRRLLGFIRKRVRNESDAEDILQEVFYQLAGNTQPIEQLTGWLFTVARNKITDNHRKRRLDLIDDIQDPANEDDEMIRWAELLMSTGDNPEFSYLRSVFWDELTAALNELPEEQKQAFVLNELEGMPFKEMAEITGETVNTLISRKRYAVLHLRNRLARLREELLNE